MFILIGISIPALINPCLSNASVLPANAGASARTLTAGKIKKATI